MTRAAPLLVLAILALPVFAQTPYPERTTEELLEVVEHDNPAVRAQVVDELGRRRDPRVLLALLARLRDGEAMVRARTAEALRVQGDERAVPHLARTLEDRDATVRARSLLALGDLGGKYLVPTIARHLGDPACIVRAAGVRALGEIGDPLSLDLVLRAQKSEKEDLDYSVTSAALIASAKIGGRAGFAASFTIAEKKLAVSWLARASAARAAGLSRDRVRVPFLEKLLKEDRDPRVCQAAAGSLAALDARKELVAALSLTDGFRRRAAVAGLAEIDAPEVLQALVKATRDPDPGVVLEAGAALLLRGKADAFPVLIGLLERPEPSVWLGAIDVLERRSGQTFGRNPPRWSLWFDRSREKLVFDAARGVYEVGE